MTSERKSDDEFMNDKKRAVASEDKLREAISSIKNSNIGLLQTSSKLFEPVTKAVESRATKEQTIHQELQDISQKLSESAVKDADLLFGLYQESYFKDYELTAQTIRDGWLYTGDVATVDEDGYIFVQSRKKEIIKVGGKRVSPKEIEEVILMLPEVVDCTIIGVEDPLLGEAIKATIVLTDEAKGKIDVQYIRNHCHQNLSMHKVPQQIEIVSALSISATGKKLKAV